ILSRRDWLRSAGGGFGALALNYLLAAQTRAANPLATRAAQKPATAKSCIFLFMEGGPSHLDTFDPKPLLNKLAGKPLPSSFGTVITSMGEAGSPLLACPRKWSRHGESGLWASEWLPHTAQLADDLCVLRSCWADGINHSAGVC